MTFVNSTKRLAMVLAWENLQEVFVMLVVVIFYLTGAFYIYGLLFLAIGFSGFSSWLLMLVKTSTSSEIYPGHFWLPYFCQAFLSHFYRKRYGFERAFFVPCPSSPHFGTFCDSDAGRNTPSRILFCACPHRIAPSGWCMALNYSYCS